MYEFHMLISSSTICFVYVPFFVFFICKPVWCKIKSNLGLLRTVYVACLLLYIYLQTAKQHWFEDDIFLGGYNFGTVLFTCEFVVDFHCAHSDRVVWRVSQTVEKFGWKRCLLFLLSVSATAYYLVLMADDVTVRIRDVSRHELLTRFENNIHVIREDREAFKWTTRHPFTKGEQDPKLFHQLFRYPMEDVRMKCVHRMPWFSGGRPFKGQIYWRVNGVPLTFTARHYVQTAFREVPEDNSLLDSLMRQYGISMYEINSTLTIHMLRHSEFGSYTCHVAKAAKHSLNDYLELMKKLDQPERHTAPKKSKPKVKPLPQCKTALQTRPQLQDLYTWVTEYRLIRVERRKEPIRAAPGSILSFSTRYWHLSHKEDIEIDYSVNKQSFHKLCPWPLHGCSMLLLMYWVFGHDLGWRFGVPPLHLFSIWDMPAEGYHLYHCLCENSYSYHSVKYLRKYFNRTVGRYEMIEITHPHVLMVVPKDQEMLNFFVNYSEVATGKTQSVCAEGWQSGCRSPCEDYYLNSFARSAMQLFQWKEIGLLALSAFFSVYLLCKLRSFFRFIGPVIRRCTLEGSMGFYRTAVTAFTDLRRIDGNESYDVFPSYSEADTKTANEILITFLESRGLKVFARDRDSHPGVSELQSVSEALKRSKRFIILLTQAYFQDRFRNDFEAAMIFEVLCDRSPEPRELLLVRLEQCDIPLWLKKFPMHDWTSANLSHEDHLHRLLKWLEPRERRGTIRSVTDCLLTFCPLMTAALLIVFASYLNNATEFVLS